MTQQNLVRIFDQKQVRSVYDTEQEKWFVSVIDVIAVLAGSENPRKYWSVLKTRLKKEGSELATNCSQLKMQSADGKYYKYYKTDVAAHELAHSVVSDQNFLDKNPESPIEKKK